MLGETIKLTAKMKKIKNLFCAAMCGLLTLSSCTQEVINDPEPEPNSMLKVMTRSGEETVVAYPVRLYVFGDDGKCKTMQILEDASNQLSVKLPEGTYSVYGLGGADATRYVLPSQEEASATSVISLQSGQQLGDLMAGQSTVSLSANGTNNLTIGLNRKVMLIKSLVIKDIPAGTGAVSVKIAPLRESICLDGSYQGEKGGATISLAKQDDGTTWKMTSENNYLLPSVNKPTITITIDNTSFSYNCATEMTANHKINIEGTYKPATVTTPTEVTLTGTITGATWEEEKAIDFNFGEGTNEQETPAASVPKVGELYQGCYVLAVDGNKVTLLSPSQEKNIIEKEDKDKQEVLTKNINTKLATWEQSISTSWRLMDNNEAKLIQSSYSDINKVLNSDMQLNTSYSYFCINGSDVCVFMLNGDSINKGGSYSTFLRPVTTITIQ